jgi:glycosyltransferase involved in cell wall biosynthesis
MEILGLCLVKNEGDVIESSLRHALQWCDRIYVADNGSTDDTWDTVQRLAVETGGRVVAHGIIDEPFYDGMRSEIYNAVHHQHRAEDWWYYLDGDEFLVEDPRPLLERALAAGHTAVRAWIVQFDFTTEDLAAWESGRVSPEVAVTERLHWYRTDWREYRFFRNDPAVAWTNRDLYLPHHLWNVSPELPLVRHYQHRSPDQIRRRVELRVGKFAHVRSDSWRDYVVSTRGLHDARAAGPLQIDRRRFYLTRLRQELPRLPAYVRTQFRRRLRGKVE